MPQLCIAPPNRFATLIRTRELGLLIDLRYQCNVPQLPSFRWIEIYQLLPNLETPEAGRKKVSKLGFGKINIVESQPYYGLSFKPTSARFIKNPITLCLSAMPPTGVRTVRLHLKPPIVTVFRRSAIKLLGFNGRTGRWGSVCRAVSLIVGVGCCRCAWLWMRFRTFRQCCWLTNDLSLWFRQLLPVCDNAVAGSEH